MRLSRVQSHAVTASTQYLASAVDARFVKIESCLETLPSSAVMQPDVKKQDAVANSRSDDNRIQKLEGSIRTLELKMPLIDEQLFLLRQIALEK